MAARYIVYLMKINRYNYIGCSVNGHKREIHHRCLLNKNKHFNEILQRSYNKNKNMSFFELEEFDNKEDMYKAEIELIAGYRRAGLIIANMTDGGEGTIGRRHTEEARKKISVGHKGRPQHQNSLTALLKATKGNQYSAKKIRCIQTGDIYKSIIDAAKSLEINYSTLSMAVINKSLVQKKFSFEYVKDVI